MLSFGGLRAHERETSSVAYTVILDGEEIACAIADSAVSALCDEFDDPLLCFEACRMLILEYTRLSLCGDTGGFCVGGGFPRSVLLPS
jgi:hypothetical protein